MLDLPLMVFFVIVAAVLFDFVNGFHDAANAIATLVATKILKPYQAVLWSAFFNFIALFLFGTGVAKTVGSGMIALDHVTPLVIFSGLAGAVVWGLVTWWLKLPTSSSHALLGGYAGAAVAHSVMTQGWEHAYDPIITAAWIKTLAFIVVAPLLGLMAAYGLMRFTKWGQKKFEKSRADLFFGRMQLVSSAFLSLMHGSNDAQKTAGIIAGALLAGGVTDHFYLPSWVLWLSYGTMALGTLMGGWRIVHTLGRGLTRLRPNGGFCAETAASLSIALATGLHLPISTTHVTTGAILGVGSAQRVRSVRWSLAGKIFWAWTLTIPATAFTGAILMALVSRL